MKKLLYLLIPIIFFACKDDDKKPGTVLVTPGVDTSAVLDTTIFEDGVAPVLNTTGARMNKAEKQKKEKVICSFGHKKFNKRTRPEEEAPGGVKGKKPKPSKPPVVEPPTDPQPPPPDNNAANVIYLNFFGKTVDGTMWNTNGPIVAAHSGLAQSEMDYVATQVAAGLTQYNVLVTYDESIFNAAPAGHKMEVIITESWEWFGQAGGVAYINSWWWSATPAFVFSKLLNYNGHNIAEAARHEACHTLGLRHQSDCSGGVVTNQYRLGWTMGNSYYVSLGVFGVGTSSSACAIQDDNALLTTGLGLKQLAYIRMGNAYEWVSDNVYLKPKEY